MSTRTYRPGWLVFLRTLAGKKSGRSGRRHRKVTMWQTRTYRPVPVGRHRKHDITPGRTLVEWLQAPELGRGRVCEVWPGDMLDVMFETGARPPRGVPVREVRVLA